MDVKNMRNEFILEEEINVFDEYKSYISDSNNNPRNEKKVSRHSSKNYNEEEEEEDDDNKHRKEKTNSRTVQDGQHGGKPSRTGHPKRNDEENVTNVNGAEGAEAATHTNDDDSSLKTRERRTPSGKCPSENAENKTVSVKDKMREDPCYVPKEARYFLHDNRFENNDNKGKKKASEKKKTGNNKMTYIDEKRWKHDLFYDYKYDEYYGKERNHNKKYSNGMYSNGMYSNGMYSNGMYSNGMYSNGMYSNRYYGAKNNKHEKNSYSLSYKNNSKDNYYYDNSRGKNSKVFNYSNKYYGESTKGKMPIVKRDNKTNSFYEKKHLDLCADKVKVGKFIEKEDLRRDEGDAGGGGGGGGRDGGRALSILGTHPDEEPSLGADAYGQINNSEKKTKKQTLLKRCKNEKGEVSPSDNSKPVGDETDGVAEGVGVLPLDGAPATIDSGERGETSVTGTKEGHRKIQQDEMKVEKGTNKGTHGSDDMREDKREDILITKKAEEEREPNQTQTNPPSIKKRTRRKKKNSQRQLKTAAKERST